MKVIRSLENRGILLVIKKLETTPVDLSKLTNVVKNDVVKKTEYNELVKKVNAIKTTDTSNLVKKTDYNTKINETERKIIDHDHAKYITTQGLTADSFTARLKQVNLSSKNDIAEFVKRQVLMKIKKISNKSRIKKENANK